MYNVNKPESKVHCPERFDFCVANTHLFISFSETFLKNSSPKFNSEYRDREIGKGILAFGKSFKESTGLGSVPRRTSSSGYDLAFTPVELDGRQVTPAKLNI